MAKQVKVWDGSQWVEIGVSVADVSAHEADTTNVHGISDTTQLATQTYVTNAIASATPTGDSDQIVLASQVFG